MISLILKKKSARNLLFLVLVAVVAGRDGVKGNVGGNIICMKGSVA